MQVNNEKDSFSYTYSAKEQEELRKIRQKYQPQEETKMDRLRRLDFAVGKKATRYSLILGIAGALIMGIGMSLVMTDLAEYLGLYGTMVMVLGVSIGAIGIVMVCLAYPLYNHIVKTEREKIAPEILKITEELMSNQ